MQDVHEFDDNAIVERTLHIAAAFDLRVKPAGRKPAGQASFRRAANSRRARSSTTLSDSRWNGFDR